jgi:uncharacterized damage-inducible protein DinB
VTEGERIAEQHRRAYQGEAWHGPAVFELLDGMSAARAAARPIAKGHSIWELVLHLTSWERIVRSRFVGEPIDATPEVDWPAPGRATAAAWKGAVQALHEESEALRVVLARSTDEKLATPRAAGSGTFYDLAHGEIQHALYHAGQIAILKKGPVR